MDYSSGVSDEMLRVIGKGKDAVLKKCGVQSYVF